MKRPASWHVKVMPFFQLPKSAEVLLIESSASRPVLHGLLLYGRLISKARKMKPIFIAEGEARRVLEEIAPLYLPDFEILQPKSVNLFIRIYLFLCAVLIWLQVVMGRALVSVCWKDLQVGDIIYDQYLAACQCARLHRWDARLLGFIYLTLRSIEESEDALRCTRSAAVLLSHRVGVLAASMANAAERLGVAVFSFGGNRYGTLIQAPVRKVYEYRATANDLAPILALTNNQLNTIFSQVQTELFGGVFNADAKLAFSRRFYRSRDEFARNFGLRRNKKNIFVMLHAFTDYPHSHFNGMLFNDFYDWFIQTLKHAAGNDSVNWVIKRHPASEFYPVKDVNWAEIESSYNADHIVFMSENADFDTRSICHVGDAIVTCVGTAGFELSALAGIPSITAGDNPYAYSGFAIYPSSRDEYFKVLCNIGALERLESEALRRAKATFIFIHRLSRVSMIGIPALSHEEQRKLQFDDAYFDHVEKLMVDHEDQFREELRQYEKEIGNVNFYALRTSPIRYLGVL